MRNDEAPSEKWKKKIAGPCSVNPQRINTAARKEFVEHFGLTWTFNCVPKGFGNLNYFMNGSEKYNNRKTVVEEIYPEELHNSFDHLAAYKDDSNHVLVVSQPYGYDKEKITAHFQKMGWRGAILDKSRSFYMNTTDIFVFATRETFNYFLDKGLFDGWAVEILPETDTNTSEHS